MKVIGYYNKSIYLTFLGMAISIIGIVNIKDIKIAMICLMLAGICDLFDGFIARKVKRSEIEKQYGIQLDSLVDTISFLVFPTIYLISTINSISGIIVAICYLFCGITRLAYFNVTTYENNKTFHGLPVTYISLILPIFNLIMRFINTPYYNECLQGVFIITYVLFILDIKIKKPTGIWYVIFSLMAITTILIYLTIY